MSFKDRSDVIAKAERRIAGFVGPWVNDAKTIIEELRLAAEIGADAAFDKGLKDLDRQMAQAPVLIYDACRGQIGL